METTSEHQTVELPMDAVKLAIQKGNIAAMRQLLEELQPYDLGQIFFRLNGVYRRRFLDFLSPEKIAELVEEVEKAEQLDILSALPPDTLVIIFADHGQHLVNESGRLGNHGHLIERDMLIPVFIIEPR